MKKRILSLVMAGILTLGVTACGSTANTSQSASAPETSAEASKDNSAESTAPEQNAGGNTLNLLYTSAQQPNEKQYLNDKFFAKFKEDTGIDIKVDFMTAPDAIKLIESEQASNNITYDALFIDTANMGSVIQPGYMEDISDIRGSLPVTFTDMFDKSTKVDGKDYFIPMAYDIYLTIANKKALDYLPAGADAQNLTWEQYADWAVAIAKGSGGGKTMFPASLEKSQLLYPMGGIGLSYGADFPQVNSDAFISGLELIAKMAQGDAFYADQANYTAPTDPLKTEAVWLTFGHMAPVGAAYTASPNKFVIGAAPKGSQGSGSTAGAWCIGVLKGAKNPENAKKIIEFMADPENNYELCSNQGGFMSPIAEVQDKIGSEPSDDIMKAGMLMLETATVAGVPASQYSDWNSVKLVYGDIFNKILADKATPDKAFLDGEQAKIDALKK